MYRVIRPRLLALAAALLAAGAPPAADARPYGYYPAAGRAGVGWGGGYRPGWGAWGGWGYRAPYYGYGYGYGLGIATGAALGWSLAAPWWPATAWGGVGYGYPQVAYPYPYAGVAVAAPAIETVDVERPQEVVVQPAPQARPGRWYYCTAPAGYYPYVASCSQPWVAVIPRPDPRPSGAANGAATPLEAR